MVKFLIALGERIRSLLNEWEDHPGLKKIIDTTEMLLAIPLGTPLAKVRDIVNSFIYLENW